MTAAKPLMRVSGFDGQIELLNDRVVIHRQGFINSLWYGFNSKREIPLMAISEVAFKDGSMLKQGEIDFIRSGAIATKNLNRVRFPKSKNEEFNMFKEKVFQQLAKLGTTARAQ